jgi:catechol 2,3-dioxygenase-like lactoylglutathione lyase family enzyme
VTDLPRRETEPTQPVPDGRPDATAERHALRPTTPRWTHIALPATDIDASIRWYEEFTPLRLLDRREDLEGQSAWLGHPDMGATPFVLVLVSFVRDRHQERQPILTPFAHIGIELPARTDVEAIAAKGDDAGCLAWPPTQMPDPIGFICALTDPDGNMIEFSYDQGVYDTARRVWGL